MLLTFRWGTQLVAILEFGGDHKHDRLGPSRDFNNVRLNLELNWALGLLLVSVGGKPGAVVEQGVGTFKCRFAHGLRRLYEIEFDFKVVLTDVLERDAELLDAAKVFERQWHYLLLHGQRGAVAFERI